MRVVGGRLRGRRLSAIQGRAVRPTADRVKEAIFNILGPKTENAKVLDIFAGTGALGIEALSRNAAEAVFVDNAVASLNVVRKNLTLCRLTECSRTVRWDVTKNLKPLLSYHRHFDIVFLDPPYNRQMILPPLAHLATCQLTAPDAVIVVEHDPLELISEDLPNWCISDIRRYGQTQVTFLSERTGEPDRNA